LAASLRRENCLANWLATGWVASVIRIAEVDVRDDEALRRWHAVEQASITHDSPDAVPRPLDALVAYVREAEARSQRTLLAAWSGDEMLGTAEVALPLVDNTHLTHLAINVDPRHRRRGVGSRLLATVDEAPWSAGRTTVLGEVSGPVDGIPAGLSFAEARGFTTVHEEDHLVMELPRSPEDLPKAGAEPANPPTDYEVLTWSKRCPEPLAEAYCAMRTTMDNDVPIGEVDMLPSTFTVEQLRQEEKRIANAYDSVVATVRRRANGEMCGYSLVYLAHDSKQALQDDTLVMPEHRGRRLGQLLKLATLDVIQKRYPQRSSLHTWTDPENHAMYRTNVRFGFKAVERMREVQRKQ
jgi:GNAT superfamily N-acetyltransferase